jgi:hypothetical protein
MVNVTTDNAIDTVAVCLRDEGLLKVTDVVDGVLHLELGPLRQGPVGQTKATSREIDVALT